MNRTALSPSSVSNRICAPNADLAKSVSSCVEGGNCQKKD